MLLKVQGTRQTSLEVTQAVLICEDTRRKLLVGQKIVGHEESARLSLW